MWAIKNQKNLENVQYYTVKTFEIMIFKNHKIKSTPQKRIILTNFL